jgi:hypothetical protein
VNGVAIEVIAPASMDVKEREIALTGTALVPCGRLCETGFGFMCRTIRRFGLGMALLFALAPATALAHGGGKEKPGLGTLFTAWEFDPLFIAPALIAGWLYIAGFRRWTACIRALRGRGSARCTSLRAWGQW